MCSEVSEVPIIRLRAKSVHNKKTAELIDWHRLPPHLSLLLPAAGLRGFHLVCCLQNFGAMLGSIPVVLSVAVAMKVGGVWGCLAAYALC